MENIPLFAGVSGWNLGTKLKQKYVAFWILCHLKHTPYCNHYCKLQNPCIISKHQQSHPVDIWSKRWRKGTWSNWEVTCDTRSLASATNFFLSWWRRLGNSRGGDLWHGLVTWNLVWLGRRDGIYIYIYKSQLIYCNVDCDVLNPTLMMLSVYT